MTILPTMFPHVPILIETVLLPFKNQITYDGQCRYYNIFFGGGITRRLNDSYQLAKAQSGIITTLPCAASEAAPSDEEQLRFYVRTERHRELYGEEIGALRQKSRSLETLYQQEMGKVHARTYSQHLRDIGLSGVWFASSKASRLPVGERGRRSTRLSSALSPRTSCRLSTPFR